MTEPVLEPREPIAIVGIGCRFPGADSLEAFWEILRDGTDVIGEMPSDRVHFNGYFDPTPAMPGKFVSRQGGFLNNIDQFDPYFFGISPREAERMDPQQRLLLEVAWEAIEDAGVRRERLAGSRTGVFIGMWTSDYESCMFNASSDVDLFTTTGSGRYAAAGRLSYAFDLRGPSMTIDTACSSSLVAIHLACQSLRTGESIMALAGGVNLLIQPHISIGYSRGRMLSPKGRCKFGDTSADGYVRSEGAGIVVLKRLSHAVADGDAIHAVIRGSAVNNDGRSSGLLVAPGEETQREVLRQAFEDAGITPDQISYMEAHGTGTPVGDPVELEALAAVLSEGGAGDRQCQLGSVKTNIGHTEAASGIAGLIKAVLVLGHRLVPGNPHFREPNPKIPWDSMPLAMQRELGPLRVDCEPALAGVNSFGITGTNAHIVLQEAPASRDEARADIAADKSGTEARPYVLPFSAHTPEALKARASDFCAFLQGKTEGELRAICYTASLRRSDQEYRLAAVGRNAHEIIEDLDAFLNDESKYGLTVGRAVPGAVHKVAFVFSGQGSQWVGMGADLYKHEPQFRQAIDRCGKALQKYVDWSLVEQLTAGSNSKTAPIDVVQPVLFAMQVALAELWTSWGVRPDAVVGHSMGELAAAHIAGVLELDDAARIICRRSQLLHSLSGKGTMTMVELSMEEAERAIRGFEDRVSIATSNSVRSTVLSGDPTALSELTALFEKQEVFCRPVKVDVASHSPQMDPLRGSLLEAIASVSPRTAAVPIFSTVSARRADGPEFGPSYWADNLRKPVLFAAAIKALLDAGHEQFVEVSPHPILSPAINQGLLHTNRNGHVVSSMRRDENGQAVMLESLGNLYAHGYSVAWERLYAVPMIPVRLPAYPWQRERFWHPADTGALDLRRTERNVGGLFYTLSWHREALPQQAPERRDSAAGNWIIFADKKGVAKCLTAELQRSGDQCLVVHAQDLQDLHGHAIGENLPPEADQPEALRRFLSLALKKAINCSGIVDLRALDSTATENANSAEVTAATENGWGGILHLVQTLGTLGASHAARLWLVTSGANRVSENDATINVIQAPIWGLARVISSELPELRCARVDLGAAIHEEELRALAVEMRSSVSDEEIAFRGPARYVSRLEKWQSRVNEAGATITSTNKSAAALAKPGNWSGGSFLITGGFGAIGLEVANWLVEQGASTLILVGRKEPPAELRPALENLKKTGTRVVEVKTDVSRVEQVEKLFAHIARDLQPLRGIFHAAGILDDGVLLQLTEERFRAVCAPKISGAWNLHTMTLKHPVELFVMFSSAMALLGSQGQGNYAAANAFMDGLAEYRRRLGMPALSINWGPWAGVGLAAAQNNRGDRLAQRGLASIDPITGIEALARLLCEDEAQMAVMSFDFERWAEFNPEQAHSSLFRNVRAIKKLEEKKAAAATNVVSVRSALLSLPAGNQRRNFLEAQIKEQAGKVLKIAPARIDLNTPLKSIGLDSLMALELRNRLEISLELKLPATLIWNYPTVALVAAHLSDRMDVQLEDASSANVARGQASGSKLEFVRVNELDDDLERVLAEIEQMPDEEVSRRISHPAV